MHHRSSWPAFETLTKWSAEGMIPSLDTYLLRWDDPLCGLSGCRQTCAQIAKVQNKWEVKNATQNKVQWYNLKDTMCRKTERSCIQESSSSLNELPVQIQYTPSQHLLQVLCHVGWYQTYVGWTKNDMVFTQKWYVNVNVHVYDVCMYVCK